MPQSSYIYAIARVGVAQTRLLTSERINRIAETKSADEALKVLLEVGYGSNKEVQSAHEYQQLIDEELRKAYDFIGEITPNEEVTDLFLAQFDFHNLKALVKNRMLGVDEDEQLYMVGSTPIEILKSAVIDRDYRPLPKHLAKTLETLDAKITGNFNPQAMDTLVDQAMYQYLFEVLESPEFSKNIKNIPFLLSYFETQCDFANVITMLRARSAKLTRDEFLALLMPEAKITKRELLEAYDQPLEGIARLVATGKAGEAIASGLEKYVETGSTSYLEKMRDDYLLGLVKKDKNAAEGIEPIVGYILAREQEAKAVRLLMTAKLNNIDNDVVLERLRELYV